MKKILTALALSSAMFAAAPAAAVTFTGSTESGGNAATPVVLDATQVSIDYTLVDQSNPITVGLQVEAGDAASYFFDSAVQVFTGAQGVSVLTFGLTNGATFDLGSIAGAFSNATASLNSDGNFLTISLNPQEYVGINLGSLDDTIGDFRINRNGIGAGQGFSLVVNGGIPEPATWAMMIAGFGFVGGAMRRRSRATTALA